MRSNHLKHVLLLTRATYALCLICKKEEDKDDEEDENLKKQFVFPAKVLLKKETKQYEKKHSSYKENHTLRVVLEETNMSNQRI